MEKQEIVDRVNEILSGKGLFVAKSIENVNHKPHPYTVGTRHIAHASDHHMGMLREETLREVPCAVHGCQLSYDEHTFNRALFISLTRDMTGQEAVEELAKIRSILEENKVDGFAFVGSFRISNEIYDDKD